VYPTLLQSAKAGIVEISGQLRRRVGDVFTNRAFCFSPVDYIPSCSLYVLLDDQEDMNDFVDVVCRRGYDASSRVDSSVLPED
jgi:hypothetical protein